MKLILPFICLIFMLTSCLPSTPITTRYASTPISTINRSPTSQASPSFTPTLTLRATQTATLTQKITATTGPTKTVTPTEMAVIASCPGAPQISLKIGDWAMVSVDPPSPNKVRSQPSLGGELIGKIQPGENVLVVDGPRCNDNYTWWFIRSVNGLEGWTVEGDITGYWLVDPLYAWYLLPNPLSSQGAKTYDLRELQISADRVFVYNITGSYNPLATPMPRPLSPETPEPNDPRYSEFGTASYAAHSYYSITGVIDYFFWVYDLADPLSRYYLNHKSYNDCTEVLRENLENEQIIKDYLDPFCGLNGGIPLLFKAGIKRIQFDRGEGVRYLIASGNYQTANYLTYHFQGLSDDGHYFINILSRPILHPYIIEDQLYNGDFGWLLEWLDGQYEQAQKTYDHFNARIEQLLNADKVTLYPALDFMDEMVSSIVIK